MSILKWPVFVALIMFGLIPPNNAACWFELPKAEIRTCQDSVDMTFHSQGASWTNSKCHKCSCSHDGMACCDGLPSIHNVPDNCEVIYNYHDCTYKVVNKKNPRIRCPYSASGK